MANTNIARKGRILVRSTDAESAAMKGAANGAPVATWARKALVRRAKQSLKRQIEELGIIGGHDKKIVRLCALLEALGVKVPE